MGKQLSPLMGHAHAHAAFCYGLRIGPCWLCEAGEDGVIPAPPRVLNLFGWFREAADPDAQSRDRRVEHPQSFLDYSPSFFGFPVLGSIDSPIRSFIRHPPREKGGGMLRG